MGAVSIVILLTFSDSFHLWLEEHSIDKWSQSLPVLPQLTDSEYLIDTTRVMVLSPYLADRPEVCSDGRRWLVVWEDARRCPAFNQYQDVTSVYGIFIEPDGRPVPTVPFLIDTVCSWSFFANAAWSGGLYLTTWNAYPFGYYGRRVDSTGNWIDTTPFKITLVPSQYQGCSDLAADNGIFCLVYEDMRYVIPGLYATRIDTTGDILDSSSLLVDTTIGIHPNIHFGNGSFFITWSRPTVGSYIRRLSASGSFIDSIPIQIVSFHTYEHSAASQPNKYLVHVFTPGNPHVARDYFVLLDTALIKIDSVIVPENWGMLDGMADLNFNGSYYTIPIYPYQVPTQFNILRIDTNCNLLDKIPTPMLKPDFSWSKSHTIDSVTLFVVSLNNAVQGIRFNWRQVTLLDSHPIPISIGTSFQDFPSISYDNQNFLLAWLDNRNGNFDLWGQRFDPEFNLVDSIPFLIYDGDAHLPRSTCLDSIHLIIWMDSLGDQSDVLGIRVSKEGVVLDTVPIPIAKESGDQKNPDVSHDHHNFFTVFQDYGNGGIYGVRIDPEGEIIDTSWISISTGYQPRVAYDGNHHYLVVWRDYFGVIFGRFVDTSGIAIGKSFRIVKSGTPSIAFGDGLFCVVGANQGVQPPYRSFAALIDTVGNILYDSIPVPNIAEVCWPEVAYDGRNFVVTFMSGGGNTYCQITGAVITPDGKSYGPFYVSWGGDNRVHQRVLGIRGTIYCVFARFTQKEYQSLRIYGKKVEYSDIVELPVFKPKMGIMIQPSPARDYIIIRSDRIGKISIYDVLGRLILQSLIHPPETKISLNLTTGVYFLRAEFEDTEWCDKIMVVR